MLHGQLAEIKFKFYLIYFKLYLFYFNYYLFIWLFRVFYFKLILVQYNKPCHFNSLIFR